MLYTRVVSDSAAPSGLTYSSTSKADMEKQVLRPLLNQCESDGSLS